MIGDERNRFFAAMKAKMAQRSTIPGNTGKPWADFDHEHLEERLREEINEWLSLETPGRSLEGMDELVDIANMCMFLWLNRADWYTEMSNLMGGPKW